MPSSLPNTLKKHGFLITFDRLFTRADQDAFDLIHCVERDQQGDETFPALEAPENWSVLVTEVLANATAGIAVPANLRNIEENTVPSWLWRHVGVGKGSEQETSVQQIFTRVVGAAGYKGWKLDIFADENQARNFYEEGRYALAQRFVALEPKTVAKLGLDWAYGLKSAASDTAKAEKHNIALSNRTIDTLVSGSSQTKWQKLLTPKNAETSVSVTFSDITGDWAGGIQEKATAVIDLMAFRHNDGSVNIDALRHATKLLTVLFDLHGASVSIGFINLAPLLLALAIPYDSDAGRNLTAALSAVITAESYATSAELAAMRGASPEFTPNRETILRSLRNHRRAAYGDRNDYEKLSVLPVPLDIKKSPDLALVVAAQRRWDEALELARQHGLRHTQVTTLTTSPTMALFMESGAQAIAPMQSLTVMRSESRTLHFETSPNVGEALMRLGYDRKNSAAIIRYIGGTMTLVNAPTLNHATLQARGFDATAIEAVENYLPNVNNVRLAFTPWIVGEDFCRRTLKIPASKLENPDFDLLKNLGFSDIAITTANGFCYGHGNVKGCKELKPQHASVFAQSNDVSPEAYIRMAAAVQSFISGAIDVNLCVDANAPLEANEKLLLNAWRQGLHSITLTYVAAATPRSVAKKAKRSMSTFLHTQARPALPTRRSKPKASSRMAGIKSSTPSKTATKNRSK